jgi:spore germination protein GerM
MSDGRKKGWIILASIAGILLLAGIAYITVDLLTWHRVHFYYADIRFREAVGETRKVRRGVTTSESYPVRMVKEFFLGPLNYQLRLVFPESVQILRVYSITNRGGDGVAVNFNHAFLDFAATDNEGCRWTLECLVRTLRANTKVRRVFILVEGQPAEVQVGNWNLAHPIPVIAGKQQGKN